MLHFRVETALHMNTVPHSHAARATLPAALKARVHALGEGAGRFVLYAASPISPLGGQDGESHGGKNEPRQASPSDSLRQPVDTPASSSVRPPAPVLLIHSINAAASAAEVSPLFEALRRRRGSDAVRIAHLDQPHWPAGWSEPAWPSW